MRARMGIQDAECRRLLPQVRHHAREDGVFDDLGEISGVVGVAIVHGGRCTSRRPGTRPIGKIIGKLLAANSKVRIILGLRVGRS
jgi:hypothetical protein